MVGHLHVGGLVGWHPDHLGANVTERGWSASLDSEMLDRPRPGAYPRGLLALTSMRLVSGGATAEIARRQPDGSWRWAVDRPNVIE